MIYYAGFGEIICSGRTPRTIAIISPTASRASGRVAAQDGGAETRTDQKSRPIRPRARRCSRAGASARHRPIAAEPRRHGLRLRRRVPCERAFPLTQRDRTRRIVSARRAGGSDPIAEGRHMSDQDQGGEGKSFRVRAESTAQTGRHKQARAWTRSTCRRTLATAAEKQGRAESSIFQPAEAEDLTATTTSPLFPQGVPESLCRNAALAEKYGRRSLVVSAITSKTASSTSL